MLGKPISMSIPLLGAHSKFEFRRIIYNNATISFSRASLTFSTMSRLLIIDTELEPDSPFFRLHTNEASIDRKLTKCHILACNSRFLYEYNFSHLLNSTHPTIHEREREYRFHQEGRTDVDFLLIRQENWNQWAT
jgi:hypothetical protein